MFDLTRERIRQLKEEVERHFRTPEVWRRFFRLVPWLPKPPEVKAADLREKAQKRKMRKMLKDLDVALKSLAVSENSLMVFKICYGLAGENSQTVGEIAERMGVDRERVERLQRRVETQLVTQQPALWETFCELVVKLSDLPAEDRDLSRAVSQPAVMVTKADTSAINQNVEQVLVDVAIEHGFSPDQVRDESRRREVVEVRWKIMVRLRDQLGMSFPAIAEFLGLDHTTVMHGYQRMKERD